MNEKFNPLQKYAHHILNGSILNWRPPAKGINISMAGVTEYNHYGVVIDRQGQYQAELFIIPEGIKEIRQHVHPDVDSFELSVSGDFTFINNGHEYSNYSNGMSLGEKNTLVQVDRDSWHGGNFSEGAAFLSFQYWNNGVEPTSVVYNFKEDQNV